MRHTSGTRQIGKLAGRHGLSYGGNDTLQSARIFNSIILAKFDMVILDIETDQSNIKGLKYPWETGFCCAYLIFISENIAHFYNRLGEGEEMVQK